MPVFNPLTTPGFVQAVIQERLVRDSAFLNLPESVAGFDLRQMTLEDYLVLRIARSPLLYGEIPEPAELEQFMWRMSVCYRPTSWLRRKLFLHKLRKADFEKVRDAAMAYIEDALQDRPPLTKTGGFTESYYSDVAFYCAVLGREYGYVWRTVMNLPVKIMFGLLTEIKEHHGVKTPSFNRSGKVLNDWLAAQQPQSQ